MADDELSVLALRDDFYRDGFGRIIFVILGMLGGIALLIGLATYIYLNKPPPITFPVDKEWRVQPPVPLEQPYRSNPSLLQWLSEVFPKSFVLDFSNYNNQLQSMQKYFTDNGWKIFLNQLNIYANYNTVQTAKLFVNATPTGAPTIINQGSLTGRWAWWVQLPMKIDYAGYAPPPDKTITFQVLVVRVSTLNNLSGVGIENVIVV